jgi:anti-sigma B factor antagonist
VHRAQTHLSQPGISVARPAFGLSLVGPVTVWGSSLPDQPSPETPGRPARLHRALVVALEHRDQGVVIVRVSGEIDSSTAPRLSATLHRELDSGTCRQLVVDLRSVDFLGAQGIAVLDNARQHAQAYHIGFCLLVGRAIRRLLQALEVIKHFPFCDNNTE